MDGKMVDHLLSVANEHVDISQYVGAPCSDNPALNPCQHDGVCVPVLNDYECRCSREYGGAKCEQREFGC